MQCLYILNKKIPLSKQERMIEAAIVCGQEEAAKFLVESPYLSVKERYELLEIPITYGGEENIGNLVIDCCLLYMIRKMVSF